MRLSRFVTAAALAAVGVIGFAAPSDAAVGGPWRQVASGGFHTCAINMADSLYCWGHNGSGQVGYGANSPNQLTPFRVGGAGVWTSVSAGKNHTCGITEAKNLYCWGYNQYGQIGTGAAGGNHVVLQRVGGVGVWASVAVGSFHTCGITAAKNLYCWGKNDQGQIGTGAAGGNQLSMHRVGGSGVWAKISAGEVHTCGLTVAKNLYCWGHNGQGQVGDGTVDSPRLTLYRVGAAGVWASGSTGLLHTCGLTNAKNLYCWGFNNSGQIGTGVSGGNHLPLHRVGAAGAWVSVSPGESHTCGITNSLNLYCWGGNVNGQIGKGSAGGVQLALYRAGGAGVWSSVAAGILHTCGITTAKNLYCWGGNTAGQIGNGSNANNQLSMYRVL